jgi:hypothetical protein
VGTGGDGELVSGYSHQGMAAAALWLAHEVAPCLAALHFHGYRVTLVRPNLQPGLNRSVFCQLGSEGHRRAERRAARTGVGFQNNRNNSLLVP